jgi:dynein heavy chain
MKLTCEPPKGIKKNLTQTYQNLDDDRMVIEETKSNNFYKLTFALSLFHATLLERRKYGSIGFNVYYKFNDSDLEAALNTSRNLIEQFDYTPWDALRFLIG